MAPGPSAARAGAVVVVFARAPVLGAVKTRLAATAGDARALEVYTWMGRFITRGLLEAAPRPWAVEVAYTPTDAGDAVSRWLGPLEGMTPQCEGDLGQRMEDAVHRGLSRGGSVVLTGTDCLAVDAPRITAALQALTRCPAVLGPSRDGGYYLLGMTQALPVFDGIAWSTDQVADQTRERLRQLGARWEELPVETDIDTEADLHTLRGQGALPAGFPQGG